MVQEFAWHKVHDTKLTMVCTILKGAVSVPQVGDTCWVWGTLFSPRVRGNLSERISLSGLDSLIPAGFLKGKIPSNVREIQGKDNLNGTV